ncbi:CAP domain-containing protein [uncultured Paracoccus sp.]|uniref:CAP domain-containing protein n=1 Tax=uncultured Paracoccus sp. TaxID=189685 RepID=UPI00262BDB1C|nr:CAP domain-containing protein [uncultured Paracoccus sp.]
MGRYILASLMGLTLAGCAAEKGGLHASASSKYPDVQASEPGAAQCHATSTADNATAAAATNAARRAAGLPDVQPNAVLARAAAAHACDMAGRGLMAHRGSSSSGPAARVKALGYAPRLTAENIAAGPYSLNRVLAEWNASRGHLENIYIPQVREVGIGRAVGSDGRTVFWSAVYGAPK